MWRYSNGGLTLAVMSDELTRVEFVDLGDAYKAWSWFADCDDSVEGGEWWDSSRIRDDRIAKGFLHHNKWFPIAEFNGYSTSVYFDARPSPGGKHGQIIVYQHDPDAIYYVAEDVVEFVKKSNDLLENNLTQLLFVSDNYERICRMTGLDELQRQLAAGLDTEKRKTGGIKPLRKWRRR